MGKKFNSNQLPKPRYFDLEDFETAINTSKEVKLFLNSKLKERDATISILTTEKNNSLDLINSIKEKLDFYIESFANLKQHSECSIASDKQDLKNQYEKQILDLTNENIKYNSDNYRLTNQVEELETQLKELTQAFDSELQRHVFNIKTLKEQKKILIRELKSLKLEEENLKNEIKILKSKNQFENFKIESYILPSTHQTVQHINNETYQLNLSKTKPNVYESPISTSNQAFYTNHPDETLNISSSHKGYFDTSNDSYSFSKSKVLNIPEHEVAQTASELSINPENVSNNSVLRNTDEKNNLYVNMVTSDNVCRTKKVETTKSPKLSPKSSNSTFSNSSLGLNSTKDSLTQPSSNSIDSKTLSEPENFAINKKTKSSTNYHIESTNEKKNPFGYKEEMLPVVTELISSTFSKTNIFKDLTDNFKILSQGITGSQTVIPKENNQTYSNDKQSNLKSSYSLESNRNHNTDLVNINNSSTHGHKHTRDDTAFYSFPH